MLQLKFLIILENSFLFSLSLILKPKLYSLFRQFEKLCRYSNLTFSLSQEIHIYKKKNVDLIPETNAIIFGFDTKKQNEK